MSPATPPFLEVRALHKRFGERVVLDSADLRVARGSIVSLFGRSGTGKSVFLKCLAGLRTPESGEIYFEGVPLTARSGARAEFRRRSRFLFQGNALFDSLTALENVALPLEQTTDLSPTEICRRGRESLRRLGLAGFEQHHPGQMSGGMQKRLALARVLVSEPELVFFDEPTAGLDPLNRNAVLELIAHLRREFGFTAIIVTHDVPEALAVSDRVALLEAGRIRFQGSPADFNASGDTSVMTLRNGQAALRTTMAEINRAHSTSEGITS